MLYNFFWSIAKILLGALSGGYFFCASGVVTLLIGFIKYIFYRNHDHDSMNVKTQKSIKIARRTVAKYREILNIPVARLRKQI